MLGAAGAAGLAWLSVAFFGVYMLARLATLGLARARRRLDDRRRVTGGTRRLTPLG